ncbi:MAG TPA: hypothetical protein VLV50_10875, partial [Stellaceae bacterium]|nr:hypothetical protein [Stellaceae bacterium]
MPLERKVAWAFLIGAPALGLVMWGLAQNGFHWPWQIIYLAIIAGGLGLVVAAILWCHIGWVWLRKMGLQMGPAVVIVIGLLIVSGGAIWGAAT